MYSRGLPTYSKSIASKGLNDAKLPILYSQGRPSRTKSTSASWGFKTFCYGMPNMCSNFRAGQKNNQCHGTVALARWAPLYIPIHFRKAVVLNFRFYHPRGFRVSSKTSSRLIVLGTCATGCW